MSTLRVSVDCQEAADYENGDEHWVEHLLDAVSVVSYVMGRIRFHLGFEGDEVLADTLRRVLQKLDSVKLESYSVRTKNVLITFDEDLVSDVEVAATLLAGIREYARLHGECDLEHHHHNRIQVDSAHDSTHEDDCDHDHSAVSTDAGIRKELFKLVAVGGVLGYFIYRKIKGKPVAFAGNPLLDVGSLVTIISGYSIFRGGVDAVQKHKKATDDTLISIAVIATILMGESLTGLSVVWLINLGRLLEAITLKRSRTAIKELMDIAPNEAWLISKSDPARVAVEKIKKGQTVRIFSGEKVPLDGKIVRGVGLLKESLITGEAIPREKTLADTVYAGSLLESGEIDIEVTNLVHETVVARMIHAIENVKDNKAPIEKIGTRFASQFVPISIGLSLVTLLFTGDIRRAITMLVIACPCAAGLATPTAVSTSIGQAARRGILIKGGTHIEAAAKIDTIIFDKTGTLTLGNPEVTGWSETVAGEKLGSEECLKIAASAEQYSTHPLGQAIVREAKNKKLSLYSVESHSTQAGLGISAQVNGKSVHIGNAKFMQQNQTELNLVTQLNRGESVVYLAREGVLLGAFAIEDTLRPEAPLMLEKLRALGIKRVFLATGDQKKSAQFIAKKLGIHEVHFELMPKNKLDLVNSLKAKGYRVAMVGDGVNDAQALAQADLSIAMGAGHCDVAIETADVTLARNDLLLVAETLDISQKTLRTIYQNFVAAVGINAGGVALGAVGKLSPFSAAVVHNASTIAVVLNSLKLGRQVAQANPLETLKEVKI